MIRLGSQLFPASGWPAYACLAGFASTLCFMVFRFGGVGTVDWNWACVAIAVLSLFLVFYRTQISTQQTLESRVLWPILLLPLFVAAQLVPLPSGVVDLISPRRMELARAAVFLGGSLDRVPVSISRALTAAQFVRCLGYALTVVSMRRLASASLTRPWMALAPVVLIGVAEAGLGFYQIAAGNSTLHGSYINRNHFAGLLEMILPIPLAYALLYCGDSNRRDWRCATAGFATVAVLASAIALSLSRSGIVAAAAAVMVVCIAHWRAWGALFAFLPAAVVLVIVVATSNLFLDPADMVRPAIWRDTLHLIRAYPLTGSGLGTYETALLPFASAAPTYRIDFAHNDYLQLLAELGAAGFGLGLIVVASLFWTIWTFARTAKDSVARAISGAALASLTALALHSLTDFNLYIPANAMTAAWIAGVALGQHDAGGGRE